MDRSKAIIRATIERDSKCVRCTTTEDLIVHHIHALADGGSDTLGNAVTLCGTCHDGWHKACEGWVPWSIYVQTDGRPVSTPHSDRVKAALAAAKARGTRLGNDGSNLRNRAAGVSQSIVVRSAQADDRAVSVMRVIDAAKGEGASSLRSLATYLNERSIQTPRGGSWTPMAVSRVIERAGR